MIQDEYIQEWTFPYCPTPPHYHLDWAGLVSHFDWLQALESCPQDPVHHGEGNVLAHTRLVVEALTNHPTWQKMESTGQAILFAAALLHDVAKPACKRQENGRIISPNHARRGAQMAQEILYRELPQADWPVPFVVRQQIVGLVRHHGLPLWFWDKKDMQRAVISASYQARLDMVTLLAQADIKGRICADRVQLQERLELFGEYVQETGCWDQPFAFPSDHARFTYFARPAGDPEYDPYDKTQCEVVLLSGMPGAGKDTWLRRSRLPLPVISLDDLRTEMKVSPGKSQGQVVANARVLARQYLRQGKGFVWNATNITGSLRGRLIALFAGYNARLSVVYLETPWLELVRRNRIREKPIPESVLANLLAKLNVPDETEAQKVEWLIGH